MFPKKLYHIVPINLFKEYTDFQGTYDPRNRVDFGKNSSYVHTTPSIEQINEHLNYLNEILDDEFCLLEIDVDKLDQSMITYVKFEDRMYYHIWSSLAKSSYTNRIVKKNLEGKIAL